MQARARCRRRRRRTPPPNQKPIWTMNDAIEAKKLAIVITITSRFCDVGQLVAEHAPRARRATAARRSPVVAHTVAVFGERPTANAFGIAVCAIATRGLGMLAWMQSRSISACSSGASCGRHLVRAHRGERDLVRGEELDQEQPAGDHGDRHRAGAGGEQHADQDGVDEPEQEQRQQHPGLESGVAAE